MRIKREDGVHVNGKEEVKEVWKSHLECLMNEKTEREAIVSSMGVEADGKQVCVQKGIYRKEVKKKSNRGT